MPDPSDKKFSARVMKSYSVLALLIIATAIAFYIVWMNRASERIISAVVPISAAALLGVYMSVFVFGGEAPQTIEFPATFIFRGSDKLPALLPFRQVNTALFLVPQLRQSNPKLLEDDADGMVIYHHLLQRAIIETLAARYASSWETNIQRFDTSVGNELTAGPAQGAALPQERVSEGVLEHAMGGNRFAHTHTIFNRGLVLPPRTTLEIQPPRSDAKLGEISLITLDNPFVCVTVQTRAAQWGLLFGGYRLMLGQANDTDTDLRQATYAVEIKTEFKRLRTGHPDMPRYKTWAEQLARELQLEYDEERIWAKAKEDYLFSKQLPSTEPLVIRYPEAPSSSPVTSSPVSGR